MTAQSGILADVPTRARQLVFDLQPEVDIQQAIDSLAELDINEDIIVGLGASLVKRTGKLVDGLRSLPVMNGPGFDIPSLPHALWIMLRGKDRGELYHRGTVIAEQLEYDFSLVEVLDTFMHLDSRDLSGYEDGTENPKGEEAVAAAIAQTANERLNGSSFVAVQQWVHDMEHFKHMDVTEQDDIIGRHISNNEEFAEAPESAHVKRAAQESYSPEAFILRRSMPWVEGSDAGLSFIAFGKSFDAYEAILNRMVGNEDGIVDNLFRFTRPINGAYYWCPPVKENKLNLAALSG